MFERLLVLSGVVAGEWLPDQRGAFGDIMDHPGVLKPTQELLVSSEDPQVAMALPPLFKMWQAR